MRNDLWVQWDEYHHLIEKLALLVDDSGWKFDRILAIARGGLRPGDALSRLFSVPLDIISASSYRAEAGTKQGELVISTAIASTQHALAGSVLVVDDLVDSGRTLIEIVALLKERYPAMSEIKTACLWGKSCSVVKPDFVALDLADSPWIHQPFEHYDNMSMVDLRNLWTEKSLK